MYILSKTNKWFLMNNQHSIKKTYVLYNGADKYEYPETDKPKV